MKNETFPNLDKDYDEVVSYIKEYIAFPMKIVKRHNSNPFRSFFRAYSMMGRIFKVFYDLNVLSGKTSSAYKDYVEHITTDDLKKEEFYAILLSEYPMDTLSEVIRNKFNHINFEKLMQAHERRGLVFTGLGMKEVLGFLLATFTLVLKTVPQRIIEETLYISFEDFEIVLFWGMILLVGYAFIVLLPSWWKISNARGIYNQVGSILKYIVIKYY